MEPTSNQISDTTLSSDKPNHDVSAKNRENYDKDILETEGNGNPTLTNIKNRIKGTEDTRKICDKYNQQ